MAKLSPNRTHDHVYAIVRVDCVRDLQSAPQDVISVKEIVYSEDVARRETGRLNQLNQDKDAMYFFQVTRIERSDRAPVPASAT